MQSLVGPNSDGDLFLPRRGLFLESSHHLKDQHPERESDVEHKKVLWKKKKKKKYFKKYDIYMVSTLYT